jgi:hypothetical protein
MTSKIYVIVVRSFGLSVVFSSVCLRSVCWSSLVFFDCVYLF